MTAFSADVSSVSLRGCYNSRMHAQIVITANQNLTDLMLTCDSSCVDIRILRSWYQSGKGIGMSGTWLNAELLLYDYSLVTTDEDATKSYLKDTSGTQYNVTGTFTQTTPTVIVDEVNPDNMLDDVVIADATTLQEVTLADTKEETFYLTITGIPQGDFAATITITAAGETLEIPLTITVPLWKLEAPNVLVGLFYTQGLATETSPDLVNRHHVSAGTMAEQLRHMRDVGIDYPSLHYESDEGNQARIDHMALRADAGFPTDKLFSTVNRVDEGSLNDLTIRIAQMRINFSEYDDHYLFGDEEVDDLTDQYLAWDRCHENGAYAWLAIKESTVSDAVGYIDVTLIGEGTGAPLQASNEAIQAGGMLAGEFMCPHVGQDTLQWWIRHRYAWQGWARGTDCIFSAFPDSRQEGANPWLDWNLKDGLRPIMSIYPTNGNGGGAVSTLNLEYYGEAITDFRYLATLEAAISAASSSTAKTAASTWITDTKAAADSIASDAEMETLRDECMDHIDALATVGVAVHKVLVV